MPMLPNDKSRRFFEYRFYKNKAGDHIFELLLPEEMEQTVIGITKESLDLDIEILQAETKTMPDNYIFYKITVSDPIKTAMLKDLVSMLGNFSTDFNPN